MRCQVVLLAQYDAQPTARRIARDSRPINPAANYQYIAIYVRHALPDYCL